MSFIAEIKAFKKNGVRLGHKLQFPKDYVA